MQILLQNLPATLFLCALAVALGYTVYNTHKMENVALAGARQIAGNGPWEVVEIGPDATNLTIRPVGAACDAQPIKLSFAAYHPVASTLHQWLHKDGKPLPETIQFAIPAPGRRDEHAGYVGDVVSHLTLVGMGDPPYRFCPYLA